MTNARSISTCSDSLAESIKLQTSYYEQPIVEAEKSYRQTEEKELGHTKHFMLRNILIVITSGTYKYLSDWSVRLTVLAHCSMLN